MTTISTYQPCILIHNVDDVSDVTSINDPKELMKKLAKERLRKCILFINQFGKLILFLVQTGIVGGTGLLAYYME